MLSVQHSVGETIPAFCQPSEDGGESSPAVHREHTGDILPYDPAGAKTPSQETKFEGQVAALVAQASAEAGDREGLARGASDENIDSCIVAPCNRGEISVQGDVRIVVREHRPRERIDLR
jgi:hypothetical protein